MSGKVLLGRRGVLNIASRIAIGVATLGGATIAHAQDVVEESAADDVTAQDVGTTTEGGEAIVVTGSRIGGVAPVGSVVTSLGRTDIDTAGVVNAVQLLQQLPQIPSLGVGQGQRYGGGGTFNRTFVSGINIRGIGPYATLTLVNGRRAVPQGPAGIAVDPTMIPTLGLQRIDVIADGASAIYGSDAVAGVVNLVTRRGYEGLEVYGRYGDGDAYHEYNVGAVAGTTWSTGQVTVAYEHGYTADVNGMDRDFYSTDLTARGGHDYRPTTCNPGNIIVGGQSYAIPAGGVTPANANQLVAGTVNRCDIYKVADIVPAQSYHSGIFNFDQEITSGVSVFVDGFGYSRRGTRDYIYATNNNLVVPSTNPYFVAPPGTNPSSVTVQYAYGDGWPQSYTHGTSKGYQITGGAEVDLFADWSVTADYTYGRTWDVNDDANVIYAPAVAAALASTDPATAFNPFGGPNNPNVIKEITSGGSYSKGSNTLHFAQASAGGTLFTLPGGDVKLAFGYEHQVSKMNFKYDVSRKRGAYVLRGTPRSRTINSFYGEIQVPLVSDLNAMPGIQSLELNAALRHDRYNDVGNTTNPKFGINWRPVEDLKLRGSYGTSFRAPLLVQVYGAVSNIYVQNYQDPLCQCLIQGIAQSGPNPNIKPESATSYTLGFDYTPSFAEGLKLSATYFDIDYKGQITEVISNLGILSIEDYYEGTGIVIRNPTPEFVAQALSETDGIAGGATLPNPVLLYIDGRSNNLGTSIMRGFDFEAAYQLPTESAGTFGLTVAGTYLTKYETSITENAPLIDQRNTIMNPLKFRARASLSWSLGAFDAVAFVNHQGGYTNNLVTPAHEVDSYTTVDLYAGLTFDNLLQGTKLGLNIRNLFDTDPPFVDLIPSPWGGGGGYDASASNPVGRVISLQLTSKLF